jgi:valyl-tRNA synthetase
VLRTVLELLHPFVPFITEELWQQLPHVGDTIMLAKYPDGSGLPRFEAEEARMNTVMEVIRSIRNIRAEMKVPMGKKAPVIFTGSEEDLASLKEAESYILPLAQASSLTWLPADTPAPDKAAKAHVRGVDIYLPLEGLIDVDKEVARIEKEIAAVEGEMKRLAGKLGNPNFLAKAPADVVAKEQAKQGEFEAKLASLKAHLELFK